VAEKALAALTAVLALGSAFLGLQTANIIQAKEQAQAAEANKNSDLSSLQNQYDALKSQYDAAQAENGRLRSQLGLGGPTANPQVSAGVSVRHTGELVLASPNGAYADLDSPQSDPQWTTNLGGSSELGYYGQGDTIDTKNSPVLYLGDKIADYDTCRSQTGYSTNNIDVGSTSAGEYFCWKTSEKRYAALRLTQLDESKATFDVVVYDPPYN